MKNIKEDSETKKLIKKPKIYQEKATAFFSRNFGLFLQVVNFSLLIYVLATTTFYVAIHYYGKQIIERKSLRLEYDNLLHLNLFYNFYFILVIYLGFSATTKNSLKYFVYYYSILLIFSFVFLIGLFSNSTLPYFKKQMFQWVNYIVISWNVVNFTYIIFYFFSAIKKNRNKIIKKNSPSEIIHEINLRTDMMKISYNYSMIKFGLHKLIPNILFDKNSYYFNSIKARTFADSDPVDTIEKKPYNDYTSRNDFGESTKLLTTE